MPHNDYTDPELSFPRLEVRVVKTDDDAFHVQVWKWTKAGEREPHPLVNGKRAGSFADVRAFLIEMSEEQNIDISPDDVVWPDIE
jgi:hypothetical protein